MLDAKKGLRLLSFSIILNIGWSILAAFLPGLVKNQESAFITYLPVITAAVLLLCYLIDFAGLRIAGHDNDRFKAAWKLKIISLLLALAAIIFGVIAAVKKDDNLVKTLATFVMVVNIISSINSVLVLIFVVKGCREISPRVEGLSKFCGGLFFLEALLTIGLEICRYVVIKNDIMYGPGEPIPPVIIATGVLAIIFTICAVLFAILYILLIFRATANVGKARRR